MVLIYFKLLNPQNRIEDNATFRGSQVFRTKISNAVALLECPKHRNIDSEVTIFYQSISENFTLAEAQIEPCCESFENQILEKLGLNLDGSIKS